MPQPKRDPITTHSPSDTQPSSRRSRLLLLRRCVLWTVLVLYLTQINFGLIGQLGEQLRVSGFGYRGAIQSSEQKAHSPLFSLFDHAAKHITRKAKFATDVFAPKGAEASFIFDQNNGFYLVDFNGNEQGIQPAGPLRSNVTIDTTTGIAGLTSSASPGFFVTSDIFPSSFSGWTEITVDATYNNPNDLTASLYTCAGVAIPGFQNMTFTGGRRNISTLSPTTHPCIRVRLDIQESNVPNSSTHPTVNELQVGFTPLPVYLITHGAGNTTVASGNKITYDINFSLSYSNDTNAVIWSELPTIADGTVTGYTVAYGQTPNPTFVSASDGGIYTASATTVNGVAIPAGSVYWTFPSLSAGATKKLTYTVDTNNGWEDGTTYTTYANVKSAATAQVTSDSNTGTVGNQPVTVILGIIKNA